MILAWALDQVIDLNNGLDISHHLSFNEELLCLATIFTYSLFCLLLGVCTKFLCDKDDPKVEDESLSTLMTVLFTLLLLFMPLNTFVRTSLEGSTLDQDDYLELQNLVLVPILCLGFVLLNLKRSLLG